jgi:hypothetical protein
MKRIFLILTIAFCCSNFLFSQIDDDLLIAQKLIGKYKTEIDTILKSLNLEYYKTYEDGNTIEFYLAKGNESVRCWTLSLKNLTKEVDGHVIILVKDICTEVFIRYRHNNINDLRDFYSIVLPPNDKVVYEKSLGRDVSHIRLTRDLE